MIVAGGKDGVKVVLNRDNLGGQVANNAGTIWNGSVANPEFGGPAFFIDSSGNSYVVYGDGHPLSTFGVSAVNGALSTVASYNGLSCLECRDDGSQPIVSSNGTKAGTAIVWALETPGASGGSLTLYAFNALTMAPLYDGVAGQWTVPSGSYYIGGALISPLVANGRVYVPADGTVGVFGLSP
jgi:hypothetical protein